VGYVVLQPFPLAVTSSEGLYNARSNMLIWKPMARQNDLLPRLLKMMNSTQPSIIEYAYESCPALLSCLAACSALVICGTALFKFLLARKCPHLLRTTVLLWSASTHPLFLHCTSCDGVHAMEFAYIHVCSAQQLCSKDGCPNALVERHYHCILMTHLESDLGPR